MIVSLVRRATSTTLMAFSSSTGCVFPPTSTNSRSQLVRPLSRDSIVTPKHHLYRANYCFTSAVHAHTHTHTHPFSGPFPGTTRVSRYQKGKTNLDFTEARDSEWQSAPRSRRITTLAPHRSVFLQAGCPSCRPANSVKALKATEVSRVL